MQRREGDVFRGCDVSGLLVLLCWFELCWCELNVGLIGLVFDWGEEVWC